MKIHSNRLQTVINFKLDFHFDLQYLNLKFINLKSNTKYYIILFSFFCFSALTRFIKLLLFVKKLNRQDVSIAELFERQCEKQPNKACLVFEGREWSFKEVRIRKIL